MRIGTSAYVGRPGYGRRLRTSRARCRAAPPRCWPARGTAPPACAGCSTRDGRPSGSTREGAARSRALLSPSATRASTSSSRPVRFAGFSRVLGRGPRAIPRTPRRADAARRRPRRRRRPAPATAGAHPPARRSPCPWRRPPRTGSPAGARRLRHPRGGRRARAPTARRPGSRSARRSPPAAASCELAEHPWNVRVPREREGAGRQLVDVLLVAGQPGRLGASDRQRPDPVELVRGELDLRRLLERLTDAGVAPARPDGGQHEQALEPRRGRVAQLPGEPDRDLRRLVEATLVQLRAHLHAKDRQRPQVEVVLGAMPEAGLDVRICQRVRPVQHRADRQVVVCPRDLLLQPMLPGHLEPRMSTSTASGPSRSSSAVPVEMRALARVTASSPAHSTARSPHSAAASKSLRYSASSESESYAAPSAGDGSSGSSTRIASSAAARASAIMPRQLYEVTR